MDLRRVGKDYLDDCAGRLLSARTIATYGYYLDNYWAWADAQQIGHGRDAFTRQTVTRYAAACAARGCSSNTVRQYETCLEQFGVYLVRQYPETWAQNPLTGLLKPKHTAVKVPPVPGQVFEEMLRAARYGEHGARDTALLWFLMETTVRVDELCGLRLGDIQHQRGKGQRLGRVTVRGKGGKTRYVFYSGPAWEALDTWLKERIESASDALFLNERRAPMKDGSVRQVLARLAKRASVPEGVRTNPHNWRRTGARRRLNNGMDIEKLREWLGHVDISTTAKHYVFAVDEELEERAEATSPSHTNGAVRDDRERRFVRMGGPRRNVAIWRKGRG